MSRFQILLLIFILIPILEIYLLITVSHSIGGWETILLVILTAILGTYLLRTQGLATLQRVQNTLQQGKVPTIAFFEGVFIFVGGILLLTPGFFTDALGFICLIPILRKLIIYLLIKRFQVKATDAYYDKQTNPHHSKQRAKTIIDGEYRRDE
ncbi:MAG: FxsA family protein [Thiomargarita sp.]|nr:FxsA family protein [Thiomargarita sp.]